MGAILDIFQLMDYLGNYIGEEVPSLKGGGSHFLHMPPGFNEYEGQSAIIWPLQKGTKLQSSSWEDIFGSFFR